MYIKKVAGKSTFLSILLMKNFHQLIISVLIMFCKFFLKLQFLYFLFSAGLYRQYIIILNMSKYIFIKIQNPQKKTCNNKPPDWNWCVRITVSNKIWRLLSGLSLSLEHNSVNRPLPAVYHRKNKGPKNQVNILNSQQECIFLADIFILFQCWGWD